MKFAVHHQSQEMHCPSTSPGVTKAQRLIVRNTFVDVGSTLWLPMFCCCGRLHLVSFQVVFETTAAKPQNHDVVMTNPSDFENNLLSFYSAGQMLFQLLFATAVHSSYICLD